MDTGVTLFSFAYIVILIVPGIIFKRFYFQGSFSGQFNSGLFADRLITSLFWGILVQLASALTFSRFIGASYQDWRIMLQTLYRNIIENKLPNTTPDQLLIVLAYAIYSVALAAFTGALFYKAVRIFELDLHFPSFRFLNHWHYYFRGEILKTSDFRHNSLNKVISTEVDLMLKDNDGKSNLFSGLLSQYTLNGKNELENIYLTGTSRYAQSTNGMKLIPGDIFIVPFSTVQNMNIRYNYQVRHQRQLFKYFTLAFSGSVLLASVMYPWFLELGVWTKILGSITMFLAWLSFSSLLMSFFPASNGTQALSKWAKIINLVFLFSMLLISYYIFKI